MYFLWQHTPYGTLRISYSGLYEFLQVFMSSKLKIYSLALSGSKDLDNGADLTVLASSHLDNNNDYKNPDETEKILAGQASKLMQPLGINTSVVWFNRGTPGTEWLETRWSFFGSPWLWMALASSIALVLDAGWDGLFWTAFWGTLAWFTVRGIKFLTKENAQGRRIFSVPQNSPNSMNSQNLDIITHAKNGKNGKNGGENH